jgi:hypothetical protein
MASIAIVRSANLPLDSLSTEETAEFELLDALPPIDDNGKPAWVFEGEPTTYREKRWLELYTKQTQARRRRNSGTLLDRNTIHVRPAEQIQIIATAIGKPAARAPAIANVNATIRFSSARALSIDMSLTPSQG